MSFILSAEQRLFFAKNGYVVAPFSIEPSLVEQVIAQTQPHYKVGERRGKIYAGQRIQDAWRSSKAVRQLALEPRVIALLKELFGREAFAFQTLNFQTGTQQKTHSDTIHFNSSPSGFMAGVWVALEDVDMTNGALHYYPGSHLLPEITMQDIGVPAQSSHYRDYENFIAEYVQKQGLTVEYGTLKKGQLFVWHSNLLHGGGPHPDQSRTRHSQVSHYFFKDCQYYTPMLSTPEQTQWRSPYKISHKMPYGTLDRYDYLQQKPSWLSRLLKRFK